MKTLTLQVEITFTDHINSDNEINEVCEKLSDAILNHIDHSEAGLAPDASETFVSSIRVISPTGDSVYNEVFKVINT